MPIEWNKVTWYSKLLAVILALLIFFVGYRLGQMQKEVGSISVAISPDTKPVQTTTTQSPITITTEKINETNFTGTVAKVSGPETLATVAETYIQKQVSDFKAEADVDVPKMQKDFGAGSPPATYELDIDASLVKGDRAQSVVLSVYTFTGGAHGSTIYKVFTADNTTGKILSLADVIASDKQSAFVAFVKQKLNAWSPDPVNNPAPVTFPDTVDALSFSDFTNWSLDNTNLTIYFDQYAIGPGVLGETAFPLPLSQIKDFLK